MKETIEQNLAQQESKINCRWCNREYDLIKRQKEISEITKPNHALEYCSNHCWFEADKTGSC